MPPPRGLCIAFSLQERFSKGLALSLAQTVPYCHVFGVAEPKHIRARSPCPLISPPARPRGATVAWHPHRPPCPGGPLSSPRAEGVLEPGGVLPGAGGWHCGPATAAGTDIRSGGVSPGVHSVPAQTTLDTGSAGVEGPWHVLGATSCWSWVPAPNDSAQGPVSTQGAR